jgi:hypothetical protein
LLEEALASGITIGEHRADIARLVVASDGRPVSEPEPAWRLLARRVKRIGRTVLRPIARRTRHSRDERQRPGAQ